MTITITQLTGVSNPRENNIRGALIIEQIGVVLSAKRYGTETVFETATKKTAIKAQTQATIYSMITLGRVWLSQTGSNRRPPAFKAD
tara:strand:+ start:374 stop:634 length:261 start_codon:yes stop_codon:yes gene_type:complete